MRVWQTGMELAEAVYRVTKGLPASELYGLNSQLRRAAVSIPSNIAEGHTRESRKEYLHHVSVAHGSLAEVETQLEIARRLGYVSDQDHRALMETTVILGKQLFALRNALQRQTDSLLRDQDIESAYTTSTTAP